MISESLRTTDTLLPPQLIEGLAQWIREEHGAEVVHLSFEQHSNDVSELLLSDGRRLMVKRGRFDWIAHRFESSRRASRLLRSTSIIAPTPLALPDDLDHMPLEAYWRIELPTLAQAWADLGTGARREALRNWGALIRMLHAVRLDGWGPLYSDDRAPELEDHLGSDIYRRLIPAIWSEWHAATDAVERLGAAVPELVRRVGRREPVFIHGDAHAGNVLLGSAPRSCVGLLDLEKSEASIEENDLAATEVLHGSLFDQPLPTGWFDIFLEGYGRSPDPYALAFFRAYHLANLGMFSGLVGDTAHGESVLVALEEAVNAL